MQVNQPDDTPKINISLTGPFGKQKVQEVKADTNRQTAQTRFKKGWGETLDLPDSPVDSILQASCFIAMGAFSISVLASMPTDLDFRIQVAVYLSVGLGVSALVYAAVLASLENASLKPAVIYRGLLLLIGVILGGCLV